MLATGSVYSMLQAQKHIHVNTTLTGDSIIIIDSTGTLYKMEAPIRKQKMMKRPQRIDRGIMQSVFIPKGQWMSGGTISYSEHEEDNLNFLVIKDVEALGYTFNVRKGILSDMHIQSMRVYFNANNVYTFRNALTPFGIDPETTDGSPYIYPLTRIFNFGLTLKF